MKNRLVIALTGVAAGAVLAAPAAMAADAPALPGIPGAQPNGGTCTVEPGSGEASSNVPALTPPEHPALPDTNLGNCQSFLNDQGNGYGSNQEHVYP